MAIPDWFTEHLGWKKATQSTRQRCQDLFDQEYGPNLADLSGSSSVRIAGHMYEQIGIPKDKHTSIDLGALEAESGGRTKRAVRAAGARLEAGLATDIESSLINVDPARGWSVVRSGSVDQFAQYEHLRSLQELFDSNWTLRSTVGRDYQISTDVMVGVPNHWATGPPFALHAAISSKLTIRSDRVQNIRFEFGTMIKNRRGRLPHMVVVTAEPLPSRLISIGRGTGEIDAIYHLLYDEMQSALDSIRGDSKHLDKQARDWQELVETARIRPYSELVDVIAGG